MSHTSHSNQPSPQQPLRDDRALTIAFAAADTDAFAQFHARLSGGLRALLARRTGGRSEAVEELLQQTWTRVWQSVQRRRYDPERAAVSTFVYAVAHNVWLQHCRKLRPGGVGEAADAADDAATLERVLSHGELLEALRNCLRAAPSVLSDGERRIVVAMAQGRTERELAPELGCAPSTVHARKQVAYGKLRRCLAEKGFSPEIVDQLPLSLE